MSFQFACPSTCPPRTHIVTQDGTLCSASFFAPYSREVEPYIRVATGDYPALKEELGRDDALAAILCSVAHEVVHYRQWVETGRTTERGLVVRAVNLVRRYSESAEHP